MILEIQIPVLVTVTYGKYRNRFSAEARLMPIVTSVRALRLIPGDSIAIEVEAFIPEKDRDMIDGPRSKWLTPEFRKCICYVDDNRKTLREFIESGAQELILGN